MNHAALLVLLLPTLAACGAPPSRAPTVTVGDSPSERDAPEPPPLPVAPEALEAVARRGAVAVSMERDASATTERDLDDTHEGRAPAQGLFLTDGEGHRFDVETIRTNSPPTTR